MATMAKKEPTVESRALSERVRRDAARLSTLAEKAEAELEKKRPPAR